LYLYDQHRKTEKEKKVLSLLADALMIATRQNPMPQRKGDVRGK
jgi:hypothetical protein